MNLYAHIHHLLLWLDQHFNGKLQEIATQDIFAKCSHLKGVQTTDDVNYLLPKNIPVLGTFISQTALTANIKWKDIRKWVLLEFFDRDVVKYLSRYPELETILKGNSLSKPEDILSKVIDSTLMGHEGLRERMLLIFFITEVNQESLQEKCLSIMQMLKGYDKRFGAPKPKLVKKLLEHVLEIYKVKSFKQFFVNFHLKPQKPEFVLKLLLEAINRVRDKQCIQSGLKSILFLIFNKVIILRF